MNTENNITNLILELKKMCLSLHGKRKEHLEDDGYSGVNDLINTVVAKIFNVSTEDMKSKTRKREICDARQAAMFFYKEYTKLSLEKIGRNFGNRDHSTVIHAIEAVNNLLDTDKSYLFTFNGCRSRIETELDKLNLYEK